MSDFQKECEKIIVDVRDLLKSNTEWRQRYAKYASAILKKHDEIKRKKTLFNERKPLHLYMNVGEAKGAMRFSLRYLGQDVAKLTVGTDKVTISTDGFIEKNKRDFGCDVKLDGCEWKNAKGFRAYFSKNPKRTNDSGKGNEEHRLESLLLTEFTKKSSQDKHILNIQPVKLANINRFQMKTPLAASNKKTITYANSSGGGIDIISRIGTGKATKLCIMEVKDKYDPKEPPAIAIKQGLAYATFIRELLRSESGESWWNIFGFKGKLPEAVEIYVACVMPPPTKNEIFAAGTKLKIGNDSFQLHHLYFTEQDNKLTKIESSLPQCPVKH